MPIFEDKENRESYEPVPEGPYRFRILKCTSGTSKWEKYKGCTDYQFVFELIDHGNQLMKTIVDHKDWTWLFDTLLKSCGIKLQLNQAWDFVKTRADAKRWTWIDPIGLQGWCHVILEDQVDRDKKPKLNADGTPKKVNNIKLFYTDREKLPRHTESPAEAAETPEDKNCPF